MANRFWILGTGNWDASTTTHWSDSSGGSGGFSVPGVSDNAVFDASSGGGIVTMTISPTINNLICGAFTGTLDANGNSPTISQFLPSGTGTRTIKLGAGIWTITGSLWDFSTTTNATLNASTSTIILTNGIPTFKGGGLTYHNIYFHNFSAPVCVLEGNNTFSDIKTDPGSALNFKGGTTTTISSLTLNGLPTNAIILNVSDSGQFTLSKSTGTITVNYCFINDSIVTGGAIWNAVNSNDGGENMGWNFIFPVIGTGNIFLVM